MWAQGLSRIGRQAQGRPPLRELEHGFLLVSPRRRGPGRLAASFARGLHEMHPSGRISAVEDGGRPLLKQREVFLIAAELTSSANLG
jgi:hypothetical protein